jgi:hypothetical protein
MAEAEILCEKRHMDLIRIETKAEEGLLSNFLSSKCIDIIFLNYLSKL